MAVEPGGGLVWLVEDDDGMRAALSRVLSLAGFDVRPFGSAEDFQLSVGAGSLRAACLVLDIRLPGASGLDLLQWMRLRDITMPVVMMTAFDSGTAIEQARQAGVAACLLKPFAGQALLGAVREAIAGPLPH